jgi:phospholipase A1
MKNITFSAQASAWTCGMLFAGSAFAQGAAPTIVDCHRIESSAERLACYDAASGRAGAKSAAPAATAATPAAPAGSNVTTDAMSQAVAKEAARQCRAVDDRRSMGFRSCVAALRHPLLSRELPADRPLHRQARRRTRRSLPRSRRAGPPTTEAKFQISFKSRLWTTNDRRWGGRLYAASRGGLTMTFHVRSARPTTCPRRSSAIAPVSSSGGFSGSSTPGYNHQSNSRPTPCRAVGTASSPNSAWRESALFAKVWYRLPESADKDDNPDITDYYGHGELSALYRWRGNSFSALLRGNLNTGKGAVQLGWMSPPLLGAFRGYVQFFSGYGESMIDYNWNQSTIGRHRARASQPQHAMRGSASTKPGGGGVVGGGMPLRRRICRRHHAAGGPGNRPAG